MTASTEDTLDVTFSPVGKPDEHAPIRSEPARGEEIGRYVVLDRLGAGGMGVVFAAYDPELDRRIAVKLLRPRGRDQTNARARLIREAQVLAKLTDPNVVTVHDVGEHRGRVFLAMEYVQGTTLDEHAKTIDDWRVLLELLEQAGRGLSAAHDAGLVHRDFKPQNVMVSDDGRVRVMDFGLARLEADAEPRSIPDDDLLPDADATAATLGSSGTITKAGALMGTPAYMSPEQFAGQPADALSDQFSFCVTCFELLHGERPFGGRTVPEIATSVLNDEVVARPTRSRTPAWIHRILIRGLERDPGRRWPSMRELLAALERDPAIKRKRWLTVGGFALAFGVGVAGLYQSQARNDELCAGLDNHLDGVWDRDRRRATEDALLATEVPYAGETWKRVERELGAWSEAWVEQRRAACLATHEHREQSEEVLELRLQCLDGRLRDLRATIDVLADADEVIAERAVELVGDLPSLDRCRDIAALRAAVPRPEDPQVAARIEALEEGIADAWALYRAGKYSHGIDRAEPILAEARALDHPPFLARATGLMGSLRAETGPYDEAEATLTEAYMLFVANSMFTDASRAASELSYVVGEELARYPEGLIWAQQAVALARATANEGVLARAYVARGQIFDNLGRPTEAIEDHQRAFELRQQVYGPRHWMVALSLTNLGRSARSNGEYEAAMDYQEQALAIIRDSYGPEHPQVANVLNNMGTAAYSLGDFEAARDLFARTLAVREVALGTQHVDVAGALNNLGNVFAELGDNEGARRHLQRSLEIREQLLGPNHPDVAASLGNLGAILMETGDVEAARDLFRRSVEIKEVALGPDHPNLSIGLTNLASAESNLGNFEAATELLTRSLHLREQALGPEHIQLGHTLDGLGQMYMLMDEPARAVEHLERAVALRTTHAGDPRQTAKSKFYLGKALWAASRPGELERSRARSLVEDAERALTDAEGAEETLDEVRDWLRDH